MKLEFPFSKPSEFRSRTDVRNTQKERIFLNASGEGNWELVRKLLSEGVDVNTVDSVAHSTALMSAAIFGHVKAVNMLLSAGANPNLREKYTDKTALDYARAKKHSEIIRILEAAGAQSGFVISKGERDERQTEREID